MVLGEVERVEREMLLVGDILIRAGGRGRAGGVHGMLLNGTREPRDDDSGQVGNGQPLP